MQPVRRNLTLAQNAALERVGEAYKNGRINFDTATICRDLIREGRIDDARSFMVMRKIRNRQRELVK